mmetsp:Transcript_63323/g.193717  ORF Transcript_63323/g.193717 Transcript_63323/m.193717 type:complete len:204 (-) Transcript_63323:626-1237(-)
MTPITALTTARTVAKKTAAATPEQNLFVQLKRPPEGALNVKRCRTTAAPPPVLYVPLVHATKPCVRRRLADCRFSAERRTQHSMKSRHSLSTKSGTGGHELDIPILCKADMMLSKAPLPQGFSPVAISSTAQPKLQMSALRPWPSCWRMTSGAIQGMEPTVEKDWVIAWRLEQPKSANFTHMSRSTRMFEHLMSRWTTGGLRL